MRKLGLVLALTCLAVAMMAGAAFAAHNSGSTDFHTWDNFEKPGSALGNYPSYACIDCHGSGINDEDNTRVTRGAGPHGGYTTQTKKCATCHTIHSNIDGSPAVGESQKLLPGSTITAVCNYCHDLTGSTEAPYYTNYMADDHAMKSAHNVSDLNYWTGGRKVGTLGTWDTPEVAGAVYAMPAPTAYIPGGDAATGGTLPYADLFKQGDWSGNNFTCDSCHTPHAIDGQAVKPYFGESARKDAGSYAYAGSRLLKKQLTVGGDVYDEYGSAWCSGCHMGRLTMTGAGKYNHPVNKDGLGYNFGLVTFKTVGGTTAVPTVNPAVPGATEADKINAINTGITTGVASAGKLTQALAFGAPGTSSVNGTTIDKYLSASPRLNSWYAMTSTDPLTGAARPDGYIPISNFQSDTVDVNGPSCQQCHASVRDVEAAFTEIDTKFTFPHVAKTQYLLVEDNSDDLCTNCHGLDNLP